MSHATPAVPYAAELKELDTQLNALAERTYGTLAAADQADIEKQLISVMTRACDFVRWVEDADPINAVHVVERVEELLNDGVDLTHSGEFRVDFLPSFAHEKTTLLADPIQHILPQGVANMALKLISTLLSASVPQVATRVGPAMQPGLIIGPGPWKKPLQPENATLASRFRRNIEMPPFKTHPLARKVFEARCEITHNQIHSPMRLALLPSGSVLVLTGTRGHSGRMPAMSIWRPNPDADPDTFERQEFEAELLGGIVHHSALDDARNLIVAADNKRIKTYSWETRKGVHIMQSGNHRGPIAILPNGRLVRSGHGSAVVWNLDDLKAHEEGHGKLGSPPHTTVKFADNKYKPSQWHLHEPTAHILSNGGHRNYSGTREHSCFLLDIEQGKKVSRFIGHGGEVSEFSTSAGDANAFATAASDGYARLYDVRHPLPQLTMDVENRQASCDAVAFAHLDGIPILFTGGNRTECIKFWDLRAKKMVYELATGNNRVTSVRWDTNHAILYAATASRCIDHDGDFYGYRSFKRPNLRRGANNNSEESLKTRMAAFRARRNEERESDGDEDDDRSEAGSLRGGDEEDGGDVNSDSDYDESKKWPSEAHHIESHFGCAFDARGHRLYRYQFKENPDLDKWPHYDL